MASLAELTHQNLKVEDVMLRLLQVLRKKSEHLYAGTLTKEELPLYQSYYERVVERNQKILFGQ